MTAPYRVEIDFRTRQVRQIPLTEQEIAEAQARTLEEAPAILQNLVQRHLDTAARARGYDDIRSAVSYADEPAVELFQTEGRAFRAWRSRVWAHCYTVLADVQAGQRSIPTAAELLAELPALDL